ncbi:MAG TPA: PadR family transcriptional regulator [Aggregatilineales bacterium]|nr:PadR family transcriptional regulator [Aggregatilineales bacterium]
MSQLTPDDALIGLLAVRARHGYELLDCFRDPTQLGEVWKMSTSQIYAVLKRLESQGLTEGHEVMVPDAPTRTEYGLTREGEARLHAWLSEVHPSASVHRVRVEFLSRLYVARLLDIPTIPIVEHQKASCQEKKHELLDCLANSEPGMGRLTLELIIAQLDVILEWLDRCELSPKSMEER